MITKKVVVLQVSVDGSAIVRVHESAEILENDKLIATLPSRRNIVPGSDYSQESTKVQAVCAIMHTPEAVLAYQASLAFPTTR